jgi:hypothetical protein
MRGKSGTPPFPIGDWGEKKLCRREVVSGAEGRFSFADGPAGFADDNFSMV